jgi:vacuolar iron transporter family protein
VSQRCHCGCDRTEPAEEDAVGGRHEVLRAAVLGVNDGLASVGAFVMAIIGVSTSRTEVLLAGLGALVAGALSMALGEYVSVSAQRDAQAARRRSGSPGAEVEETSSPTAAALASLVCFALGGLVPVISILVPGISGCSTVVMVVAALVATGWISARLVGADIGSAIRRHVVGGVLALGITYVVGVLLGNLG